ncbi:DUF6192 family protein [Nonomuraea sp. NPDC050547]|uniref:DUF6192 family protein n=1 Tax=Nonomuraea sp. NPDC050547 TaxID=3364368 RepID=UPI0037913340
MGRSPPRWLPTCCASPPWWPGSSKTAPPRTWSTAPRSTARTASPNERRQEVPRQTRSAIEHARQSVRHQQKYIACGGRLRGVRGGRGQGGPLLRDQSFTPEEVERVHANLARVRGATDWIETALDTGNLSMDEGLAALLRGE